MVGLMLRGLFVCPALGFLLVGFLVGRFLQQSVLLFLASPLVPFCILPVYFLEPRFFLFNTLLFIDNK